MAKTVEINVDIIHDDLALNAIKVDTGDSHVWIPRSLIHSEFYGEGNVDLEVSEWFARDQDLI